MEKVLGVVIEPQRSAVAVPEPGVEDPVRLFEPLVLEMKRGKAFGDGGA